MITKTKAFTTTSGKTFPTIQQAQLDELTEIFSVKTAFSTAFESAPAEAVADAVMTKKAEILAILTSTGRKRRTVKSKKVKAVKPGSVDNVAC